MTHSIGTGGCRRGLWKVAIGAPNQGTLRIGLPESKGANDAVGGIFNSHSEMKLLDGRIHTAILFALSLRFAAAFSHGLGHPDRRIRLAAEKESVGSSRACKVCLAMTSLFSRVLARQPTQDWALRWGCGCFASSLLSLQHLQGP